MKKHITDEKTGLKYELVGDYYFLARDDEPDERRPIGYGDSGIFVTSDSARKRPIRRR